MRCSNRKLILAVCALAAVFAIFLCRGQELSYAAPPVQAGQASPWTGKKPKATPVPASPMRGSLLITEIMEKNRAVAVDEDGDFPDWIELTNASQEEIDLDGWRIADRIDRFGWVFPSVKLAPGKRLLVFASGKDRRGDTLHTDFSLSERDCIRLYDRDGFIVDTIPCVGCEADVSLIPGGDGSWEQSLYPTPGFENTASGYLLAQHKLRASGPLVINEVTVNNTGSYTAGNSDALDWVEIRNISGENVQLSDYYLSDRVDKRLLWRLPEQTLPPGACVVFVCDDDPLGFYGITPCTGFALNAAREQLYLSDRSGALVDWVSLRDIPLGGSYGRMDNRSGFFFFTRPSPGQRNEGGRRMVSPMPVSLTPDGIYEGSKAVRLRLEGSGTLRYTINGAPPTEDSEVYSEPIRISKTCVVRVKNFAPYSLPSSTLALSFIFNEGHSLPVVSFAADSFTDFAGTYDGGAKGREIPGTFSFFRGEDERVSGRCSISLNGETSLALSKKNLAIRFRPAYGPTALEHDFFGVGSTSFTDLLLRAGQDQYKCNLRNELAQRLAEKAGSAAIYQRCLFCALYLDGRYAGLYALEDRPNASMYASAAGVARESVEAFEPPAPYGSEFFRDVVNFPYENDITVAKNYQRFCAVMDIDSLIDWLFLEGFCGNTDLTFSNLRYARSPDADGKWHLLFYDLDASFQNTESVQTNLLNEYGQTHIQVASYSVPLLKNKDFRERFLKRAAELLSGPLTNEGVIAEIDRIADEIRSEVERDYARRGKSLSSWEENLASLRSLILDRDWRQCNIDELCSIFKLGAEERETWFGEIDAKRAG